MKESTLNIRIDPKVKMILEDLAQQKRKSMADVVAWLIENCSSHEEALKQVITQEKEMKRLEGQVNMLNVPRFQVLFDELYGKKLNQRVIESKSDLLEILAYMFKYELEEEQIEVTSPVATVQSIAQTEQTLRIENEDNNVFDLNRSIFYVLAVVVVLFTIAFTWRLVSPSRNFL